MPQIHHLLPLERTMTSLTLALYQPDIPQNAGAMLRTCACLGVSAAIIGPAGFPTSDRDFRRAGMDYLDHVTIDRHASFAAFQAWRAASGQAGESRRLLLLSTRAAASYLDCDYRDRRHSARRPGIRRRAGRGPRRRRSDAPHSHVRRHALAERRRRRGDRHERGASAVARPLTRCGGAQRVAIKPSLFEIVAAS